MAGNQHFRSAFNGFNREDVVRYIEYLNTKNNNAINQLKSENQILSEELEQLRATPVRDPELEERCATLQEENTILSDEVSSLEAEVARLKEELSDAEQKAYNRIASEELEAYRRAERVERAAQERTQQIYLQATGTLADATAQVDDAADQYKQLSQQLNALMSQMQLLVDRSRNALVGAANTMYTIRPTDAEKE